MNAANPNHIFLNLKNEHRIFVSYIPPSDSQYSSDEYIYCLPSFLSPSNSEKMLNEGGDLNSRVGNVLKPPHGAFYGQNHDSEINEN